MFGLHQSQLFQLCSVPQIEARLLIREQLLLVMLLLNQVLLLLLLPLHQLLLYCVAGVLRLLRSVWHLGHTLSLQQCVSLQLLLLHCVRDLLYLLCGLWQMGHGLSLPDSVLLLLLTGLQRDEVLQRLPRRRVRGGQRRLQVFCRRFQA